MVPFQGVFSLLLTPFEQAGAIDWQAYERYVTWQVAQKPAGLFAVCGTSEMAWLELDERLELARRAVAIAGDIPVVATGNLSLDRSKHQDEIARMADTGVASVVLVPPPGLGADQAVLEAYFASLIGNAPAPMFIYEWPFNKPHLIDADVVGRLGDLGLRGIKDTTCTVAGIAGKIEAAPTVAVFQANTPYLLEAVEAGAKGMMAITTGAYGDLGIAAFAAAEAKPRATDSLRLHGELTTLDAFLRMAYPIGAKYLLQQRGLDFGLTCRWPVRLAPELAKAFEVLHTRLDR